MSDGAKKKGVNLKCVTPMFRYYEWGNPSKAHIVSRAEALEELTKYDNNLYRAIKKHNSPRTNHWKYQMISCQNCWACLINKSAEKATEIMCEVKTAEYPSYFITLTYDDQHIPIADELIYRKKIKRYETKDGLTEEKNDIEEITYVNDGTWGGTLNPEDLKRFINTMRKEFERKGFTGAKVYAAGEYGSKTHRPHYHLILINVPLDISQFYSPHIDENYKEHWKSKQVERWWSEKGKRKEPIPLGMIDIAEVEWSCAAYVARYTTKKLFNTKTKEQYYEEGKRPEFTRSSKNIGMDYYEKNKFKIYENDEMIGRTVKGNVGSYKPPKKFDKKFKEQFPEEWENIKKSREKAAERAEKMQQEMTDYTDLELQNIATKKVLLKNNMLPRIGEW